MGTSVARAILVVSTFTAAVSGVAIATGVDNGAAVATGMGAVLGALVALVAGDNIFAIGVAPATGNLIAPGYNEKRSF